MTLRITVNPQEAPPRIAAAGRLTRDEVGDLEQTIESGSSDVCLDLEDLRSADSAGLAALRRLRVAGVEMRRVPPHIAWRIEGGTGDEGG